VGGGTYLCRVRKSLKRASDHTSAVTVGDVVGVELHGDDGAVESVEPRRTVLLRRAAGRTPMAQPLAANADCLIAMTSARTPPLNLRACDRLFCLAEDGGLGCALLINKSDLAEPGEFDSALADYRNVGYSAHLCSAVTGDGLAEVAELLRGRTSVLCGPSGVGKSTLLNTLEPGLDLRTAEISGARDRGRHTTTSARMFALPSVDARVIDTPGLREIGLWRVAPIELGSLFPEMRAHLSGCSMPRCTHSHEPGCAVKAAAEAGAISPHRYDSYLRILAKLDSA